MEKKKIKVNFVDYWKASNYKNHIYYELLSKKYDIVISDEPDYVFCSLFGDSYKQYDCIRIFYSGENFSTDFNEYDYGIDFDDYVFLDRHFRLPVYLLFRDRQHRIDLLKNKHLNYLEKFKEKDSFCSFVYSNDVKLRTNFYEELSKYKRVDSGGRVLNNYELGKSVDEKITFEKRHKFSIAFDNDSRPGYTTEKLVDAFAAGTVPIYYGASDVSKYFNPEAMLILEDRDHIPELIEKIKEIDNNDELYLQMLSQPAITADGEKFLNHYEKELEKFLYNIFDQPLDKARRRTNKRRVIKTPNNNVSNKKLTLKNCLKELFK